MTLSVTSDLPAGATGAALAERKAGLRPAALARRAEAAAAPHAGDALRDRFLAAITVPEDAAVSGYWPSRDEIDPRPLLTDLADRGHAVGLPVVVAKAAPLRFRRWSPGDALEPGAFKIDVPAPSQPEVVPLVLLVPLLAFDRAGYRLGYGGGFYDRTLATLRRAAPATLAVGLAFAGQEIEAVPRDERDARLDRIVTEREVLSFG